MLFDKGRTGKMSEFEPTQLIRLFLDDPVLKGKLLELQKKSDKLALILPSTDQEVWNDLHQRIGEFCFTLSAEAEAYSRADGQLITITE